MVLCHAGSTRDYIYGLPLDDAFPVLHNSAKMCKNTFKVSDSLSKKCSKLKERLVVIVRRTCDQF